MNNEQAHKLGAVLKTRRDELGLSTYKLAETAGIDQATVVRLEKGAFMAPRPDKLARIAEGLGLSSADLFAMAGYITPLDLPSLDAYLRIKFCDLPEDDLNTIAAYVTKLARKRGTTPRTDPTPTATR